YAEVLRVKQKVLATGQTSIQIVDLRADADPALHFDWMSCDVDSVYERGASGWKDPCSQDSNRGCLPRAVWSEQTEELTACYCKRDPVNGANFDTLCLGFWLEGFLKVLNYDYVSHHSGSQILSHPLDKRLAR